MIDNPIVHRVPCTVHQLNNKSNRFEADKKYFFDVINFIFVRYLDVDMELKQFKTDIIPLKEKLLNYSLKALGNMDDAEDVVQETFLKLWSIRKQLDSYSNIGGLAMQITKNSCIDKLRNRKSTVEPDDFYVGTGAYTPHSQLEIKDSTDLIRRIIDSLPELQKQIILMRDVEGYELDEIAAITGTQTSAVTMNLSRARKRVREKFMLITNYEWRSRN